MAITIAAASRNAACNAIVDLVDLGSTNATGRLVLMASGDVVVSTLAMSAVAFGNAAAGVATAAAITDDVNAVGGSVVAFKVTDRNNNEIFRGSVTNTAGNGDLKLSSILVGASDTVTVSSLTVTMPAA